MPRMGLVNCHPLSFFINITSKVTTKYLIRKSEVVPISISKIEMHLYFIQVFHSTVETREK